MEDGAFWEQQQGPTSCAVISQVSVYESITGIDLSEADACRIAQENGWFDPESGTSPEAMGKLLNHLGIETFSSYDADLTQIATAFRTGRQGDCRSGCSRDLATAARSGDWATFGTGQRRSCCLGHRDASGRRRVGANRV